jgi:hypothetical protein
VLVNLIIAVVLTFAFRALKLAEAADQTSPADYEHDPA